MSYIIAGNIEFKYNGGEEIPQDVLDKASKTVKDIEHGFSCFVFTRGTQMLCAEPDESVEGEEDTIRKVVDALYTLGFSVSGENWLTACDREDIEYAVTVNETEDGGYKTNELSGEDYTAANLNDSTLISELERRGYKCQRIK